MSIYEKTINEYLEVAGSKSPTPGGGSVSAVTATNAAAMVSMVANLTLGKKGYDEAQDEAARALEGATDALGKLKSLTARDMAAFDTFMTAWRMKSGTQEEKEAKAEAMETAAQNASTVPLEICKVCLEIIHLAVALAPVGNRTAISDVGVAIYVAEAALRAAMLSVDINLPGLKTQSFIDDLKAERARLIVEADELKTQGLATVKSRLG